MNSFPRLLKITIIHFTFLTLSFHSMGQSITPQDGTVMHNDKMRACLVVNVDPEPKELKQAWRSYVKDNYDVKLKGIGFLQNKDLLSAKGVLMEKVSANTLDFYTEVLEDDNGSQMKVFAAFGYDIYIDKASKPEAYQALDSMLKTFLKVYLPEYYEEKIKSTQKRIKVLSKEIDRSNDEIEEDKKKIKKLTQEIEELTEEIGTNEQAVKMAKKKLKGREAKLDRVKSQLKNL